jgi:O-antigen/teichoic acid export membrane protein
MKNKLFLLNKTNENIFDNFFWFLGEKLLKAFFTFLISVLIARYLGPYRYGQIILVSAYIAFFQAIVNMGIDGIVVREISTLSIFHSSKNHAKILELLSTAFSMRLFFAVFFYIIAIVIMHLLIDPNLTVLTATIGCIILFLPFDVIELWYQSQHKTYVTSKFKILTSIASVLARLAIIFLNGSLVWVGIGIVSEYLAVFVALLFAYKYADLNFYVLISYKVACKLFSESWLYMLSGILIILTTKIDSLIINYLLFDKSYVGKYGAVVTIVGGFNLVISVISAVFLPSISKLKVISEAQYRNKLIIIFKGYLIFALITFAFISFFANNIIKFIYGVSYLESSSTLAFYAATLIPYSIMYGQVLWISNEKKSKILFYQTLLSSFLVIIFNFMLIPKFGLNGAALASFLSLSISVNIVPFLLCRDFSYIQLGIKCHSDPIQIDL